MKLYAAIVMVGSLAATGCTPAPAAPTAPDGTALRQPLLAAPGAAPVRNGDVVHVPFFIQDVNGQPPASSSTPLFEARQHNPILAPDGHQVTLAEFNAVSGYVSVQCLNDGTHVTVHLANLIPQGVYTIWNLVFKAPGFDPSFANLIGLGAIGASTGAQNVFRASASGEGVVSATTPAGPLSVFGEIGACAPVDLFEWHVVGVYHIDGQSHGSSTGPAGTAVEQFGFIFRQ